VKPIKNVAASVHQRLLNLARQSGRPFNELAQYYALERWLYRLAQSEHRSHFVLKGALMLLVWKLPVTRPTRDIDLLGRVSNDLEAVREIIASICRVPAGDDGMSFAPESVTTYRIAEDADYEGVRATFQAALGNTRLPMQIDIGFSDVMTPGPMAVIYPVILENPAPELLGYNRETAIAEKFQAMVKLGELNSRMKDFFDVWVLARTESFRGAELARAIEQTFQRRSTPPAIDPPCFAESFATNVAKAVQWQAFIRRGRFGEPPATFADVVKSIADFLGPVNSALLTGKPWSLTWQAGGPWTSEA
jgi:predicted nucleotidyltransferase component of viral defense system